MWKWMAIRGSFYLLDDDMKNFWFNSACCYRYLLRQMLITNTNWAFKKNVFSIGKLSPRLRSCFCENAFLLTIGKKRRWNIFVCTRLLNTTNFSFSLLHVSSSSDRITGLCVWLQKASELKVVNQAKPCQPKQFVKRLVRSWSTSIWRVAMRSASPKAALHRSPRQQIGANWSSTIRGWKHRWVGGDPSN